MPLIAIPNVSEGRDERFLDDCVEAVVGAGARLLDLHADADHNRSVLTVTAEPAALVDAMAELAVIGSRIDLTEQTGAHPRVGGLDVCPFVPHEAPMGDAVDAAHAAGQELFERTGLPVYFYGAAAKRSATVELPALRRGGLAGLAARAERDVPPDLGPPAIDMRRGVVCVGARAALIAFNVWIEANAEVAAAIARAIRSSDMRALGLAVGARNVSQVSMNLVDPALTGIDAAFDLVRSRAAGHNVEIIATEIVGLVPERFLPDPDAETTRLLIEPGRSLESALVS